MKRIVLIILIAVGSFFVFWKEPTYKKTFEQPELPKKTAVILPPQPKEKLEAPPPPPTDENKNIQPVEPLASPTVITPVEPPPPPRKAIAQSELFAKGLLATVNFLCPNANGTYSVATGAIINPRGYIISNAHIIDKNKPQPTCSIRSGSPAVPLGMAKLVFIPREYHSTSNEQLQALMDISIWKLEGARTDWPFWEIDMDTTAEPGEQLLTQSYPAELLSDELVFKSLGLLFSNTVVSRTDASIIASQTTIAAQHGSSGGILIDPYTAKLRGIIFGISSDTTQAINERLLYAITPSRINGLVWQETKKQFGEYLATLPEPSY